MSRRILLLALLALSGCRLSDLLNPGPPPEEPKCYRTVTVRLISNGTDTTYHSRTYEVPCEAP